MPQWAGSCWYELRYLDPTNEDASSTRPSSATGWARSDGRTTPGGVDLYVGGVEHAVLHLLYARFWHKVLFDLGTCRRRSRTTACSTRATSWPQAYKDERGIYIDGQRGRRAATASLPDEGEPVTREWGKMGKSLKNAVSPDDIYESYGADTLRLYEMAMGPLDASRPWETRDVVGMYRFLQRLWRNIVDEETGAVACTDAEADDDTLPALHRTIAAVRDDMDAMRFNTAIAKLIELNNHADQGRVRLPPDVVEPLVLMVAPLAPHIAEELWRRSATSSRWPSNRSPRPIRRCWSTTRSSTRCRSTARSGGGRRRHRVEAAGR